MFARRVLSLALVFAVVALALTARLGQLTIAKGDEYLADAQTRLVRTRWLPTVRGRILDRKGRVLAADRASYEVAIDYRVLSGEWAESEGWRLARKLHSDDWPDLDADERQALADRYTAACQRHVRSSLDVIARTAGVDRGVIQDAIDGTVARIERAHAATSKRRRAGFLAQRSKAGMPTNDEDLERLRALAAQPIAEQRAPQTVLTGLSDRVGFAFLSMLDADAPLPIIAAETRQAAEARLPLLPGVSVRNTVVREHPLATVDVEIDRSTFPGPLASDEPATVRVTDLALPIVGGMRDRIFAEDTSTRLDAIRHDPALAQRAFTARGTDRGRYVEGDQVGATGVEASAEHLLRGLRGVRTEHLQTGAVSTVEPDQGRDVTLTIDAALQARVRALLDPQLGLAEVHPWQGNEYLGEGTYLYGAAVVLDVASDEILAMVSTPVPPEDGDWAAAYGLTTDAQVELFKKLTSPEINKAIAKPYPPGSIAKAVVLCGAAERGEYHHGERIAATGHLLPDNPNAFRSWIYKRYGITHRDQLGHDPDAIDALTVSSNVFFYNLGRRLGPERLADVYAEVGVGEGFGLGVGPEWPGRVGSLDGPGDGTDLAEWDAILMGIGQGPITWTPMHAASAFATIARSGTRIHPKLVRDGKPPVTSQADWPAWAIDDTLAGLRGVVAGDPAFATGRFLAMPGGVKEEIFNVPGVTIYGKTGTATAPHLVVDPDGDGPEPERTYFQGEHSWFVVLAGEEGQSPRYVVAVVMDYAGSGGKVSGPICNQIVHALVDEGYLTPDARAEATR